LTSLVNKEHYLSG